MQIHLVNPRWSVFGLIYSIRTAYFDQNAPVLSFLFVSFSVLKVLCNFCSCMYWRTCFLLVYIAHFYRDTVTLSLLFNRVIEQAIMKFFVVVGKISIIFNFYPLLYAIFPRLQVLTKSNLIFLLSMLHNAYLYFFIDRQAT